MVLSWPWLAHPARLALWTRGKLSPKARPVRAHPTMAGSASFSTLSGTSAPGFCARDALVDGGRHADRLASGLLLPYGWVIGVWPGNRIPTVGRSAILVGRHIIGMAGAWE